MSGTDALDFVLTLEEAGWAKLDVTLNGASIRIDSISYLTTALDDLLIAALHLSFGYFRETVIFDNEGWHTELRFEVEWIDRPAEAITDEGIVADPVWRLSVVEIASDETETVLLTGRCASRDAISAALLQMGDRVWAEHGAEGYHRLWISSGFPNRALAALRAALEVVPAWGRGEEH